MFDWKDDKGHNDYDPLEPTNEPTLTEWIILTYLISLLLFFLSGLGWLIHRGFSMFI